MDAFEYPYGDSDVNRAVAQSVGEMGAQMAALIEQRIAETKEQIARARAEVSAVDVRMSALEVAKHMVPASEMISFADDLSQFVLTGNKPSAED